MIAHAAVNLMIIVVAALTLFAFAYVLAKYWVPRDHFPNHIEVDIQQAYDLAKSASNKQ